MKPNYVRVIIDRGIRRELDYSVPETLADRISIGSRVRVPFRDKFALATVLATLETSDAKGIRPIDSPLPATAPADRRVPFRAISMACDDIPERFPALNAGAPVARCP